jgi:hypothetical protein
MSGWRAFLPKEHGAYGQLAFPLAASYGVAGISIGGLLLSLAVMAAFLAHEPAAIVLGQRGVRVRRELGASATTSLSGLLALTLLAGIAAAFVVDPVVRWSFAVPAVPGLLLAIAMVVGREKSWYGETLAAMAFAGVAVPVTMAAGASLDVAWAVAIPFALLFITTTLAVRVVILRVRGGGDPRAAAATRRVTFAISAAALVTIGLLTLARWLQPAVIMAAAPGLLTAAIVAARPPAPAHLRFLGWSLVGVSTLTAAIVVLMSE